MNSKKLNYKIKIQYDGTDFAGWQIQPNAPTIQQTITDAIKVITQKEVNLIGSGRTDAGVHALGQIANFRIDTELDIRKFTHSLNAVLPESIAVSKLEQVDENFHARFDACKRSYIYLISLAKSPFYKKYSYLFPPASDYDVDTLNEISKLFLGKHDFTSFAKSSSDTKTNICEIFNIHWRKKGSLLIFYVEANRFLHGMVRTIVGTIKKAAAEKLNVDFISEVLNAKDRTVAGESVPAQGLFLYKVKY